MAKTPIEIKSLARAHTDAAIKTLVGIMNQPNASEAARVAAVKELLDRGWGKATQLHGGDPDAGPVVLTWLKS